VKENGQPIETCLPTQDSSAAVYLNLDAGKSMELKNCDVQLSKVATGLTVEVYVYNRFLHYLVPERLETMSINLDAQDILQTHSNLKGNLIGFSTELLPPIALSHAAVRTNKDSFALTLFVDCEPKYCGYIRSMQYDFGQGFEPQQITTPDVDPFTHYAYTLTLYSPIRIVSKATFQDGAVAEYSTVGDDEQHPLKSEFDYYATSLHCVRSIGTKMRGRLRCWKASKSMQIPRPYGHSSEKSRATTARQMRQSSPSKELCRLRQMRHLC
jgi:hypothetical protein